MKVYRYCSFVKLSISFHAGILTLQTIAKIECREDFATGTLNIITQSN